MFSIRSNINIGFTRHNLVILVLKHNFKKICTSSNVCIQTQTDSSLNNETNSLESLVDKYESKLLYNSVIEKKRIKFTYKVLRYNEKLRHQLASIQPLPLSLKYLSDAEEKESTKVESSKELDSTCEPELIQFPYNVSSNKNVINENETINNEETVSGKTNSIDEEIRQRSELFKDTKDWMTAYDNYENDLTNNVEVDDEINYGTPDPKSRISNVPCGGCGALLHCKDTGIPGYIPSEIFKNSSKKGGATLQAMICQRCYFFNEFNLALQVSVSATEYPKILSAIMAKRALVVLMVDLMDFPCSIWPGVADILGPRTPIVVVGNKIDLLPRDGKRFFNRVKENLLDHIKLSGFATSNILHVALISAKSGFGVEDLITSLQTLWKHRGDVYLVGCTNVGKSSLFNTLIQSDYCKIQASDLIQKATISQWPGTTLNMLKFPITRPSGHRMYLRHHRLMQQRSVEATEKQLKEENLKRTNSAKYATLSGYIGQSFVRTNEAPNETRDSFSVAGHRNASGKLKLGINENDPEYVLSRWCFDTPGVIQPDQIIHLLTIEELMAVIPKEVIRPQTFCVKPGTSLFIAGIARLDYLEGPKSVRLTVFRSKELPITVCNTEEANSIYQECLGTELLGVPMQGNDRLSNWPGLEPKDPFNVSSTDPKMSCADVVLSSAGWIAISCITPDSYKFQAWTPEKRGIYLRNSLLPGAVKLRGPRIRNSVAYKTHKFV